MSVSASVTHGQRAVTLTFPPPRAFGDLAEIAADAAREVIDGLEGLAQAAVRIPELPQL